MIQSTNDQNAKELYSTKRIQEEIQEIKNLIESMNRRSNQYEHRISEMEKYCAFKDQHHKATLQENKKFLSNNG